MNITQAPNAYPRYFAHPFDMCRRRHQAAQRMEPDPAGQRDTLYKPFRPTMDPATIVEIARIGGVLTREQYRSAWYACPDHRPLLDAVAAVQHEGWAA